MEELNGNSYNIMRKLTEEELLYIEMFLEQSTNIIGTTLAVPLRFSHSVGKLNLHLYIEDKEA